jgi:hypothetical protein
MEPKKCANSHDYNKFVAKLEKFYVDLAEISSKQGYSLDFLKHEAPPCKGNGELLSLDELRRIYGNDMPLDWKWRYDFFLGDNECLQTVLRELEQKGYQTAFNFTAQDAFLGNIVVRIDNKWFAIGECERETSILPWNANDELMTESSIIEIIKLWPPFFLLSNVKRMEIQLAFAQPVAKVRESS